MKKAIVGILNKIDFPDVEMKAIGDEANIECLGAKDESELCEDIAKYDAVIISHRLKLSNYTIDKLTNCKAIVCACVGYDNVDYRYAAEKGIRVFNVPDYGTNDVADHAFALFLSNARRILDYDRALRTDMVGNWNSKSVRKFHRITSMIVGVIGLGRIGTAFAIRAKAFGMQVCYYDPYKPDGYDKTMQMQKVERLVDLFEKCDVISIHAPLTSETNNMINWDLLKQAKKAPVIINTARGNIVNNCDVCRAIAESKIDSYLADVIDEEPPTANSAFLKFNNDSVWRDHVIITPHAASYAEESQYDMRFKAAKSALLAINNDNYLVNCINIRSYENG